MKSGLQITSEKEEKMSPENILSLATQVGLCYHFFYFFFFGGGNFIEIILAL